MRYWIGTARRSRRSEDVSGNRGGERGAAEPELAELAAPIVNNSLQGVIQAPPRPSWIPPNENPHRLPGTTKYLTRFLPGRLTILH